VSLDERANRFRTLARLSRSVSSSLDLDTVLGQVVEATRELFGIAAAAIWLADDERRTLHLQVRAAGPEVATYPIPVLRFGEGTTGWVAVHRRSVVVDDVYADGRFVNLQWLRQRGITSYCGLPLIADGVLLGVLSLSARAPFLFTIEDAEILESLAAQAASAIRNARLFLEATRRRQDAERIGVIAGLLPQLLGRAEIAWRVAEGVREGLHATAALVYSTGRDSLDLDRLAWAGSLREVSDRLPAGAGMAGLAIAERRPVVSADVRTDPRIRNTPSTALEDADRAARLAVPLIAQERIVGALVVLDREGRVFDEDAVRLAEMFAAHAAVALEAATLLETAERRREESEALAAAAREIAESLDVAGVGRRTAEHAQALFSSRTVRIRLAEPDSRLRLIASLGRSPAYDESSGPLPAGTGTAGRVFQEGRPFWTSDELNEPTADARIRDHLRDKADRALLSVPMRSKGLTIGTLSIGDVTGRVFSTTEITLLRALADQAALALENARLFEDAQRAYREVSETQAQLVQAQKMEAVGLLAGGIAHDFNNLLTVIGGRSALLLEHAGLSGAVRTDVELIGKTADRAAALTRQLLAFSRKQVLEPRAVEPNALVGGVAPMLRRLIGEHIELVIVAGRDLGHVLADPGQVEQVIMNLVVNARDAMPDGGMVKIETAGRDLPEAARHAQGQVPPGPYVTLSVQDAGSGMDPATLARIFEPFFTTKEPGKGTGLGLSTVHGIVHQSGGYIGVDSAPGRGTTFTIYLPRIAAGAAIPDAAPPTPSGATRGTETVLLVEDEEEVRRLASEILKGCGYTVLETGDPLEALTLAERRSGAVDLLVTDMVMPAMGGSELAERLKITCRGMRVLYISGYTDELITQAGTSGSGRAFLHKPFTPHDLTRKVREVLTRA
jgi:signal transduction histidine kinase/putative methionine-R-sulfoxide reductase with GAF domain